MNSPPKEWLYAYGLITVVLIVLFITFVIRKRGGGSGKEEGKEDGKEGFEDSFESINLRPCIVWYSKYRDACTSGLYTKDINVLRSMRNKEKKGSKNYILYDGIIKEREANARKKGVVNKCKIDYTGWYELDSSTNPHFKDPEKDTTNPETANRGDPSTWAHCYKLNASLDEWSAVQTEYENNKDEYGNLVIAPNPVSIGMGKPMKLINPDGTITTITDSANQSQFLSKMTFKSLYPYDSGACDSKVFKPDLPLIENGLLEVKVKKGSVDVIEGIRKIGYTKDSRYIDGNKTQDIQNIPKQELLDIFFDYGLEISPQVIFYIRPTKNIQYSVKNIEFDTKCERFKGNTDANGNVVPSYQGVIGTPSLRAHMGGGKDSTYPDAPALVGSGLGNGTGYVVQAKPVFFTNFEKTNVNDYTNTLPAIARMFEDLRKNAMDKNNVAEITKTLDGMSLKTPLLLPFTWEKMTLDVADRGAPQYVIKEEPKKDILRNTITGYQIDNQNIGFQGKGILNAIRKNIQTNIDYLNGLINNQITLIQNDKNSIAVVIQQLEQDIYKMKGERDKNHTITVNRLTKELDAAKSVVDSANKTLKTVINENTMRNFLPANNPTILAYLRAKDDLANTIAERDRNHNANIARLNGELNSLRGSLWRTGWRVVHRKVWHRGRRQSRAFNEPYQYIDAGTQQRLNAKQAEYNVVASRNYDGYTRYNTPISQKERSKVDAMNAVVREIQGNLNRELEVATSKYNTKSYEHQNVLNKQYYDYNKWNTPLGNREQEKAEYPFIVERRVNDYTNNINKMKNYLDIAKQYTSGIDTILADIQQKLFNTEVIPSVLLKNINKPVSQLLPFYDKSYISGVNTFYLAITRINPLNPRENKPYFAPPAVDVFSMEDSAMEYKNETVYNIDDDYVPYKDTNLIPTVPTTDPDAKIEAFEDYPYQYGYGSWKAMLLDSSRKPIFTIPENGTFTTLNTPYYGKAEYLLLQPNTRVVVKNEKGVAHTYTNSAKATSIKTVMLNSMMTGKVCDSKLVRQCIMTQLEVMDA